MTNKGTVTLETERLLLRQFMPGDAEAMYRNWASDPEVTRFMHYETCETLEQTRARIDDWLAYIDNAELSDVFAIILKDTREIIGTIDYAITDSEAKSAEVGYPLGKQWWHNGYAAEALKAIIRYCFEERGLNRIWAMYNPLNANSGAVMRKAGMIYEGTFRKDRVRKGVLRDSIQYAILAEDYFLNGIETEKRYDKLVRDNIPAIICAQDNTPVTQILDDEEYLAALDKKLAEEVKEYLDDKSDGEICDILEVIYAICAARGITQDQIAEAREQKRNKNGAFDKRIWLEKVVIGSK